MHVCVCPLDVFERMRHLLRDGKLAEFVNSQRDLTFNWRVELFPMSHIPQGQQYVKSEAHPGQCEPLGNLFDVLTTSCRN